jgi:hypothetical protein
LRHEGHGSQSALSRAGSAGLTSFGSSAATEPSA